MGSLGKARLLYLTADGLLEPLCFSQVVRVVEGLARRGWQYTIVSLEKPKDLQQAERVRAIGDRLQAAGVRWEYVPYAAGGGAKDALRNQRALVVAALRHAKAGAIDGIHARAYHGAFAALAAKTAYGTPYLFDTRAYWFDERIEEGRWFTSPLRVAIARGIERQLYAQAAAVVTLTELQATDVRGGKFGPSTHRAVQCIPTCADFDDFRRRPPAECTRVPAALRTRLAGKRVLGIVGALNRSYLVDETLVLARLVLEQAPDFHVLVLSSQHQAYAERTREAGLPADRVHIHSAPHEDMPEWLSLIDWGCLLLQPASPAKRASMPTKLAEFFACGVRPVHFGCNEEVARWVNEVGSGLVLPGVGESNLRAAAMAIARATGGDALATGRRQVAERHFSLARALGDYEGVVSMCSASG